MNKLITQLLKKSTLLISFTGLASFCHGQNLISPDSWTIGSGSVGVFTRSGGVSENVREWGEAPNGQRAILWKAIPDGNNNADGGWSTSPFSIDHTKMYRFSVWIKKTHTVSGSTYLGCYSFNTAGDEVTQTLSGSSNTNPYFWSGDLPKLNKWYLLVGYIHGSGDSSIINYGGVYDGETGAKLASTTDFKFTTEAVTAKHRSYLYYDTNTSDRQYFYAPRVDLVTGDEPSIESLLSTPISKVRTLTSNKDLNKGWYTIAKNTGNRASAKFSVKETKSGYHSSVHFYAHHYFGRDHSNQINVLGNAYYSNGGALKYIRIVEGSTYAGALLQVYIDADGTTGCYAEISENIQNSGWQVVDWEPATTTLPNGENGTVTTEVDLDSNNGMIISHDLRVGNKLDVAGTIRAEEVKVETGWADYVFHEDYELKSLSEVSSYIEENHHLPGIPTAEEVAENGIKLGEMNAKLLEKIEELTLYLIEQNEKIEIVLKENNEMKESIEKQNQIINQLTNR